MDVEKEKRLRKLCRDLGVDGVLLRRRSNIAWIADGADVHCDTTQATGIASVLWTPRKRVVITNVIEAPRLEAEEFKDGWTFEAAEWWHDRKPQPHEYATDFPDVDRKPSKTRPGLDDSAAITALRASLTPLEIERARALGRDCAELMEKELKELKPGLTEHEVAASFSAKLRARAIHAPVLLVAADDRIVKFRHPIPTQNKVDRMLMLVVCAQRHGLIVAMTRLVFFGKLPAALKRKHEAVCAVDSTLIGATKPGAKWSEILSVGMRIYRTEGFGAEWRLHHQGGPLGYECRDFCVTPSTQGVVVENQLVAWNPSIAGTKSEDTILSTGEVLTAIPDWPTVCKRPDILARRRP